MNDFSTYIYLLVAAVVGFFIIKRIASCLFKSIALIVLAAALAAIYLLS